MNAEIVSIIMPVYNAEKYLQESIDSILNQSYSNFELIVIDDGSTDNSKDIINSYTDERIKIFYFNNSGCSKQRNYGLSVAKGNYIALMDADDISEQTRIENQLEILQSNKNIDILGTNAIIIDINGKKIQEKKYPEFHDEIEFAAPLFNSMCFASMMTYKKILIEIGGYMEELLVAEDHDLILRLLRQGYKTNNYQKNLYRYRISDTTLSRTKSEMQIKNHYKSSITYLNNSCNSERQLFYYEYRRGLLEYYFGDILMSRKYLFEAFRNNSAPRIRLFRLILSSLLGNGVIKFLRKKGILESFNKLVFKLFKFDLQKIRIKR